MQQILTNDPCVAVMNKRLGFISLAMTAFGGPNNHDTRARQLHWLATTLGNLAERDQLLVDEWLDQVATTDLYKKATNLQFRRKNGDPVVVEWMLVRVRWLELLHQIDLPRLGGAPTRAMLKVSEVNFLILILIL
jgi:hypothetical protein